VHHRAGSWSARPTYNCNVFPDPGKSAPLQAVPSSRLDVDRAEDGFPTRGVIDATRCRSRRGRRSYKGRMDLPSSPYEDHCPSPPGVVVPCLVKSMSSAFKSPETGTTANLIITEQVGNESRAAVPMERGNQRIHGIETVGDRDVVGLVDFADVCV